MTSRFSAACLGFAALLGLAGFAQGQDNAKDKSAPAAPKADAKDKKADGPTVKSDDEKPKAMEHATFGGGCFWCLEAFFERLDGVKSVVSGYAGGSVAKPSYEMVCTGLTGHAEVVQIEFDPAVISFDDLLDVFWLCHNPTTLNRQGPDEGTQYRSVIFFHDEAQKKAALKSYEKATAAHLYRDPIVTELFPLTKFYPAEKYHQDYYRKNPSAAYCQMVITPKLRELRVKLAAKAKAKATAATKEQ